MAGQRTANPAWWPDLTGSRSGSDRIHADKSVRARTRTPVIVVVSQWGAVGRGCSKVQPPAGKIGAVGVGCVGSPTAYRKNRRPEGG